MQLSKPKIKKNYIQVWCPCMTSTLETERANSYNPRAHMGLWQLEDIEILTEFHTRPYSNCMTANWSSFINNLNDRITDDRCLMIKEVEKQSPSYGKVTVEVPQFLVVQAANTRLICSTISTEIHRKIERMLKFHMSPGLHVS